MNAYRPLPEIYQVEVTSRCQARCPRCPRSEMVAAERTLDVRQLSAWIARGDFAGSWFVELQLAGEPLLHGDLAAIIDTLHDAGILVGMSTNGSWLLTKVATVRKLDALTVSIDDRDLQKHAEHRPGVDVDELAQGLRALERDRGAIRYLNAFSVQGAEETGEVAAARAAAIAERWACFDEATFVRDCRVVEPPAAELCVNPWTSVSIQADGTVVSCCYVWGQGADVASNVYGNMNDAGLAAIWAGPEVARKRAEMRAGVDTGYCSRCYQRSPVLLHLDALSRALRKRHEGASR
jgi:MoaA/NifB/PqqE/SkfB family radical SAM enzyme